MCTLGAQQVLQGTEEWMHQCVSTDEWIATIAIGILRRNYDVFKWSGKASGGFSA